MATLESIQMKITKLQAQAEALIAKRASAVLDDIRSLMEKHGLTTADIEAHTRAAKGDAKRRPKAGAKRAGKAAATPPNRVASQAKSKLPPKYINPKTGGTWSGHARPPAWIANVKDRSKFLIVDVGAVVSDAGTASKQKAAAKSAGKSTAKGKLPPKYINPETGETWSGHARPPAWMKDVKDRSKFLIAGADAAAKSGSASKTKAVAKKSGAKKVSAKKVAAKQVGVKKAAAKKVVVKKARAKKAVSAKAPATKKAPANKAVPAASKKASASKVPMTEAAMTGSSATVESGVGSTT
jgi:DNA-binding protein H-NS